MQTRAKFGIVKSKTFLPLMSLIAKVEPTSFSKASEHPRWIDAMTEEYRALIANNT